MRLCCKIPWLFLGHCVVAWVLSLDFSISSSVKNCNWKIVEAYAGYSSAIDSTSR